jgi:hypothetical protein
MQPWRSDGHVPDGHVPYPSLRNYLMKYLAKTFIETIPDWAPEELVFNAIAWSEGYRFFGCSRDLSHEMMRPKKKGPKYTWLETSLTGCNLTHEVDVVLKRNPTFKIYRESP